MSSSRLDQSIPNTLEPGEHFEQLIGFLPEINYFAKDTLGRYVNRVRLQAVRRMLTQANRPLASAATKCGFYDQRHVTAVFTRHFGITRPRKHHDSAQH